jgi:D-xylose transport system substrate-binding protein
MRHRIEPTRRKRLSRRVGAPASALLLAAGLYGCQSEDRQVIAFLLPDSASSRWENVDRTAFESAVEANCTDCQVMVYNADGDPGTQQDQLRQAKEDDADVVVLAAVDTDVGESMVQAAGDTPVIAYDRFVSEADYHVSFDGSRVGTLQAEALLDASRKAPRILMLNGAVGDTNATAMKLAAHKAFDDARVEILAEEDLTDSDPDTAEAWVTEQLRVLRDDRIDAVYAANDTQAEGVAAAFRKADRRVPVITGQDSELSALQRIITGEQTMTVYKSFPDEADRAAEIAVQLLDGDDVEGVEDYEGVPSVTFEPVPVTIANLTNTVVRDGVVSIDEMCTQELRKRCEELGIS